jgi:hypothetical protein
MPEIQRCLVCGLPVPTVTFPSFGSGRFLCQICGEYTASWELATDGLDTQAAPAESRHIIQGWIKRRGLTRGDPPELTDLTCANVIRDTPRRSPIEKMEQLLLAFADLCRVPGRGYLYQKERDYPYSWSVDEDEGYNYVAGLSQQKFIEPVQGGQTLSRTGWQRAEELRSTAQSSSKMAFVAMWFHDSMDIAWTGGLQPGIRDAGFEPYRIKEDIHSERIDARLIAAIRSCRFLVADASGERTAVYYEAGFAEGLGKLVIWTCQKEELAKVSFDTRQYRHIVWTEPADLRRQLADTIKALVP